MWSYRNLLLALLLPEKVTGYSCDLSLTENDIRREAAWTIRQFAIGRLSLDECDKSLTHLCRTAYEIGFEIDGLDEIYEFLESAWFCDVWNYRLRGKHKLPRETRRLLSRFCLYLYTGISFRQETFPDDLTGENGIESRHVWPFCSRDGLRLACEYPPLLAGF